MKSFVSRTSLIIFISCFFVACSQDRTSNIQKIIATVEQKTPVAVPKENRVAFGWDATGMLPDDTIHLIFSEKIKHENNWLRITVAQEIWHKKLIHAFVPKTNIDLGTFDIKYSSVLVPYEIEIPYEYISQINQYGINLVLEGRFPFWFYNKTSNESTGLIPHILSSDKANGDIDGFLNCFLSLNSIQAFGWREGTVLDGMWQIYSRTANQEALNVIKQHLELFFDTNNNLIFENAGSRPNDNRVDGIESTIPFATLARLQPNHPILKTVVDGWNNLKKENGMIIDGTMVSAEGCYTVSYPMAVLGKAWGNKELIQEALSQLKHRFVLVKDGNFYLRYYTEGKYTYKDWARGAAWFLLGYVRTIEEVGTENVDEEIISKFREAVDIALSMQCSNGLWNCFMDDHENSLPDASGSAGIGAAIMSGIKLGILPREYKTNVENCYKNLQSYITPDGFLKGVAQDNRGGEELQRSDYRVIAQMGMGMMAQLYAAL